MRKEIEFDELCHWSERQKEATDTADANQYTLFGGSRGPGKSYWLRWFMIRELMLQAERGIPSPRVGLFCEDYPSLKDRQISKIVAEFPDWLGELKDSQTSGLGFYLWPEYGSGVLLLRNLDDASKYQSSEFAAIGVDELTKNKLETFNLLRGSLRYPGIPKPRFVAASNPGSIGHAWVYQYWMEKQYPPEMTTIADEFAFVPGLPDDNPYLDDSYWQMLETLPPDLARAWRWGDWTVFAGQVFNQWTDVMHVIDPIDLPVFWPRWRSIDWGYSAPFCCLWFAKDPDTQRIYVYRELYQTELTDRQQAKLVLEHTQPDEMVSVTYADPSMWARKNMAGKVSSTADEYKEAGVRLTQADNNRIDGKRRVDRVLGNLPDGKPGLIVFRTCTNLVRTLPMLPYDEHNIEDVDSDAEDHAYDALRYGLTNYQSIKQTKHSVKMTKYDEALAGFFNQRR